MHARTTGIYRIPTSCSTKLFVYLGMHDFQNTVACIMHIYVEKHGNEHTYIVITRTLVYIRVHVHSQVPTPKHAYTYLLPHHNENLGISHALQVQEDVITRLLQYLIANQIKHNQLSK
jgi:hypothetical protein